MIDQLLSNCQNTSFNGTETKMNDSILLPVKSSYIFGKEHVNWFHISGVMMGRSWTIKSIIFLVNFSKLDFLTSPIITPLILDQFTWSLPKNVITFHGQQDGIIHFCLSPIKTGVLALWIYISTKMIMDFFKLNCSTSFKLQKHPFYWDWDKNEWFHLVAREK